MSNVHFPTQSIFQTMSVIIYSINAWKLFFNIIDNSSFKNIDPYYYYYYLIYCTFSACAGKRSPIPSRSLLGLGSVGVEREFTLAHMIQIIFNYWETCARCGMFVIKWPSVHASRWCFAGQVSHIWSFSQTLFFWCCVSEEQRNQWVSRTWC